jgi:hypothetical protein
VNLLSDTKKSLFPGMVLLWHVMTPGTQLSSFFFSLAKELRQFPTLHPVLKRLRDGDLFLVTLLEVRKHF